MNFYFKLTEYVYLLSVSYVFGTKLIKNCSSSDRHDQPSQASPKGPLTSQEDQDITFFEQFAVNFMNDCRDKNSKTVYQIRSSKNEGYKKELRPNVKDTILENPEFLSIVKQRVLYPKSSLESILSSSHLSQTNIPGVCYFENSYYTAKFQLIPELPTSADQCQNNHIFSLQDEFEKYGEFYDLTLEIFNKEFEHSSKELEHSSENDQLNKVLTDLHVGAHTLKNKNPKTVDLCLNENIWVYHGYIGRCRFRDFWDYFGSSDQFSLYLKESRMTIKLSNNEAHFGDIQTIDQSSTEIEAVAESSTTRQIQPERNQEAMIALPHTVSPSGNNGPPGSGNFLWLILILLPLPFIIASKLQSYFQKPSKKMKIYQKDFSKEMPIEAGEEIY